MHKPGQPTKHPRTIALGSDHAAWPLKEEVRKFLVDRGFLVEDFSQPDDRRVDYTEVGALVARSVADGTFPRAVLLCGTGLGMTIVANKFPGVRACLCHDSYSARMSRAHNNSNILVLGGRIIGPELAKDIASIWLDTPFEGGRHARRLAKIAELEKENTMSDIQVRRTT